MPKSNARGGKKTSRMKKNTTTVEQRIVLPENGQIIGQVVKLLGGSRVLLSCSDGVERSGQIPGRMYKRVYLNPLDYVLCTLNSLGGETACSIELKYSAGHIAHLTTKGLIAKEESTTTTLVEPKKEEWTLNSIVGEEEYSYYSE